MADGSKDQGGHPAGRPLLRPFSGNGGSVQGSLRPLGSRRIAVSPLARTAPPTEAEAPGRATPALSTAVVDGGLGVDRPTEASTVVVPIEEIAAAGAAVAEAAHVESAVAHPADADADGAEARGLVEVGASDTTAPFTADAAAASVPTPFAGNEEQTERPTADATPSGLADAITVEASAASPASEPAPIEPRRVSYESPTVSALDVASLRAAADGGDADADDVMREEATVRSAGEVITFGSALTRDDAPDLMAGADVMTEAPVEEATPEPPATFEAGALLASVEEVQQAFARVTAEVAALPPEPVAVADVLPDSAPSGAADAADPSGSLAGTPAEPCRDLATAAALAGWFAPSTADGEEESPVTTPCAEDALGDDVAPERVPVGDAASSWDAAGGTNEVSVEGPVLLDAELAAFHLRPGESLATPTPIPGMEALGGQVDESLADLSVGSAPAGDPAFDLSIDASGDARFSRRGAEPESSALAGTEGDGDAEGEGEGPRGATEATRRLVQGDADLQDFVARSEAQAHVLATLDMVARRVRAGEIVPTLTAGCSPEAVLAGVLASLLSPRT